MIKIKKINKWRKTLSFQFTAGILSLVILLGVFFSFLIFYYPNTSKLNLINTLIQAGTFVVAVVGIFYTFKQLLDNKKARLVTSSFNKVANKDYKNAISDYEELLRIDSNDQENILNLAEIHLINKNILKFNKNMALYDAPYQDGYDLIYNFLQATKNLFEQNLGLSNDYIKKIIEIKQKGDVSIYWNFQDIKESGSFKNLTSPEAKTILANLINYILGSKFVILPEYDYNDLTTSEFENGVYSYNAYIKK